MASEGFWRLASEGFGRLGGEGFGRLASEGFWSPGKTVRSMQELPAVTLFHFPSKSDTGRSPQSPASLFVIQGIMEHYTCSSYTPARIYACTLTRIRIQTHTSHPHAHIHMCTSHTYTDTHTHAHRYTHMCARTAQWLFLLFVGNICKVPFRKAEFCFKILINRPAALTRKKPYTYKCYTSRVDFSFEIRCIVVSAIFRANRNRIQLSKTYCLYVMY